MTPDKHMTEISTRRRNELLRVLGVTFGIAVTVGNTIGAGILRAPGQIASGVSSVAMFYAIWIAGAVYALLGANALAELGTLLPKSGGQYNFARTALGPYAGFVVGWSDWISTCGSAAAVAIVLADYVVDVAPAARSLRLAIAAAVILLFAIIQWKDVRTGGRTQEITSAIKAIVFAVLIVACFAARGSGVAATALPAASAAAVILALQSVIYTYDGWTGVLYFSEEVREPGRDIPRAMFGGVILVAIIYLLLNASFLHVLPINRVAADTFVAGTVAREVFGPAGETLLRLLMTAALLSSVSAFQMMAPRVLFAMSRDGLSAAIGARVNEGGTPVVALAGSTVVALAFLLSGTFNHVIAILSFFFVASYAISFLSLFVLRRRMPDAPRPYRSWGYPITTVLALAGSVAFLIGAVLTDLGTSRWALALFALSGPLYLLQKWLRNRSAANVSPGV